MGLFSTLKKGLVESGYLESSVLTTETPISPTPSAVPAPASTPAPRPTISYTGGQGTIDPEIVETLLHVITTKGKVKGYENFQILLTAMAGLPDETMRYSMALNALKAANGIEPATVLAAVDERLAILVNEETAFHATFEQHRTETSTTTRNKLADISANIEKKELEIAAMRTEAQKLTDSLASMEAELVKTQREFSASLESLRSTLVAEKTRITPHVK